MADIIHVDFVKKRRLGVLKESHHEAVVRQKKKDISESIESLRELIKGLCKSARRTNHYSRFLDALSEELSREKNT